MNFTDYWTEDSLQFDGTLSRFMTGWLGTEYFIAACLALFIVDRAGRRNLMMWGAGGMAVSLAIIGGCLSIAGPGNRKPAIVATVFIFVYDTFFAVGWLGVAWVRVFIRQMGPATNMMHSCTRPRSHLFAFVLRPTG